MTFDERRSSIAHHFNFRQKEMLNQNVFTNYRTEFSNFTFNNFQPASL